jgi:hypothetical protein
MNRRIPSIVALVGMLLAVGQQQSGGGAPAAGGAPRGEGSGGAQYHYAEKAPSPGDNNRVARAPTDTASSCGGTDCDAIVPYQESGPWVASCDRFTSSPANKARSLGEAVSLAGKAPDQFARETAWCVPSDVKVAYLIITLPDPVSSHLALYFDRTIESVEAALRTYWLFLDRYWLPWRLPGTESAPGNSSQDIRQNAMLDSLRNAQPGVMIFSADPPKAGHVKTIPYDVMYAFLVGESPTGGIGKTQFANAISYARLLGASPDNVVPVVGPYFSGSVRSVIELQSDLRQFGAFDFASGTMTGAGERSTLRAAMPGRFRPMLHDDDTAQQALLCFLQAHGLTHDGSNVAVLTESETEYGAPSLAEQSDALLCDPIDRKPVPTPRSFHFPRDLSRLRNASPDTFGVQPTGPTRAMPISAQGLAWNWKDANPDVDRVPSFSGPQEPLSQQAVMLSISESIRRQGIQYVGIAATDIFDILFVSKFLTIAAPNLRLFVLDSDLLMVSSGSDGRELNGTLAVTTYPLSTWQEDWSQASGAAPDTSRALDVRISPSRLSEGIYHAVSYQLGRMPDYAEREIQYPDVSQPLWLTMVGRAGFWPVAMQSAEITPTAATAAGKHPAGSARRLTYNPRDGITLILHSVLLAWCLVHFLGMALARSQKWIDWLAQFQVRGTGALAQQHACYLMCASLALSAMSLSLVISYARVRWCGDFMFNASHGYDLYYGSYAVLGLALFVSACWIAPVNLWRGTACIFVAFPWGLYVTTLVVWFHLNDFAGEQGAFFALRTFYWADGVSALLPVELLWLLYYIWAWIFIRKARLSASKRILIPDLGLLGSATKGLKDCADRLASATDNLIFDARTARWLMAGVLGAFVVLRPCRLLRSVEGPWYDRLMLSLVLVICLLIILSWGRYIFIWSNLRKVLRGLELTKLRHAFSRFPKEYSWHALWYEDAQRRAYTISARSVECYRALTVRLAPRGGPTPELQQMITAFENVIESDTKEALGDRRAAAVEALQIIFRSRAEELLRGGLRARWDNDEMAEVADRPEQGDKAAESKHPCGVAVLAENFIALRFIGLIHYESAQLKNLVALLSSGFVLALLAIASYPFLARRECVWGLGIVFMVFGAAIIVSFAQMDRDAILSRLSRTEAGQLDWSFALRVASYGTVPLLALLTSQFPSIGRSLFSWLAPTLTALH